MVLGRIFGKARLITESVFPRVNRGGDMKGKIHKRKGNRLLWSVDTKCGAASFKTTPYWKKVTCKNCLRKKEGK